MKEVTFVAKNSDRWLETEKLLASDSGKQDPDRLAELFIQLTDDLSYSKTFYPNSRTTQYLNSVTAHIHQTVYKNKKEKKQTVLKFWKFEFPEILFRRRKELLFSFLIFFIAVTIGVISSAGDSGFIRLILGDSYVNMTLENIEKGDPLAVYKKMNGVDMFLGITFNNIRVSFLAFIAGLFLPIGTVLILLYNGIMLGSFHYFFYERELLFEAITIVWIHGTLEIAAVIIAGSAGIILGNSILFPKTYSRIQAFRNASVEGVKIIIGLIPFFITAGFVESFVTRFTKMPVVINLLFISASTVFIFWYLAVYPSYLSRGKNDSKKC